MPWRGSNFILNVREHNCCITEAEDEDAAELLLLLFVLLFGDELMLFSRLVKLLDGLCLDTD